MSAAKVVIPAIMTLVLGSAASGENWPGWRGPAGHGVSSEKGIPVQWELSKNLKWKADVAGVGHSSPIVWNDRVFVTTAVSEDPGQESFYKGLYIAAMRAQPDNAVYSWDILCLDRDTGKLLWKQTAVRRKPVSRRHEKNSYASATPITDGTYVYAFFGDQGVHCYDFNGRLIWSADLGVINIRGGFGTGSSPILYRDRLIVNCDQDGGSFLVALDKQTGQTIWRTERDELPSWSTPYISLQGSRPELITSATRAIRAYDPETGKMLWECRGLSSNNAIPSPVAADGLVFVSSGWPQQQLRPLVAFRPGGSGDLTLKDGGTQSQYIAWTQLQGSAYNSSPVVYAGYIYVIYDQGYIACYEAKTGKQVYGKRRIDVGALFSASPVAVEGRLYCLSEDGDMYVIQTGPEYKLLAKNSLGEVCMASPAVSGGKMFIRAFKHLYCIE